MISARVPSSRWLNAAVGVAGVAFLASLVAGLTGWGSSR